MAFSPKDPAEVINITFEFAELTTNPLNPQVEIAVVRGVDPDADAMLTDLPIILGSKVVQTISYGVAGCIYDVRCKVDAPDGSVYVLADQLPVIQF